MNRLNDLGPVAIVRWILIIQIYSFRIRFNCIKPFVLGEAFVSLRLQFSGLLGGTHGEM